MENQELMAARLQGEVWGLSELAAALKKSPRSILADRSRAPARVPPTCTPRGTRVLLWLKSDVLQWLAGHRAPPAAATPTPSTTTAAPGRRGRPRKAERLAAAAAGLSVPALRARAAGGEGGEA